MTGLAPADPASVLSAPKVDCRLPKVVSDGDVERLLAVYGPTDADGAPREQTAAQMRDAALLEFLFSCGARVSEASGLLLSWVNFPEREVKVFGKRAKERIVPLSRRGAEAMARYLEKARPELLGDRQSDYFFVSNRGNQMKPDGIRKIFGAPGGGGWTSRSRPMPCATPSPPTFWRAAPICAASRTCWGTRASPPRRSTPM